MVGGRGEEMHRSQLSVVVALQRPAQGLPHRICLRRAEGRDSDPEAKKWLQAR